MISEVISDEVVAVMLDGFKENNGNFSATRDVFSARIQSYVLETKKYLEAAIIGEIGNNTFDHNFVYQNNHPKGVYCDLSYRQKYAVLADYGRGVRQSLLSVLPFIKSDREGIETAFTRIISGRSPEHRGNGLKFVSGTIQQNNWHLYFQSGSGSCLIDRNGIMFTERQISLTGCLAILDFTGENQS